MEPVEAEPPASPFTERPNVILSSSRRWAVTIGVMLGAFLAALEATVVGAAMPTVIAHLGGLDRYSWVFSAYLLTSTVTVPVWGRLSDLFGRRPLYIVSIFFFLVGSMLSGASQTMTQLIVFRAIQGLGAGGLVPIGMTITGDIFTVRERARMQGLFSGVWGLASILGPLAGGFITDQWSWRWVFYINLPFGLAAALVVGAALVEPRRVTKPVIDYAGSLWMTVSITLLLAALVEAGDPRMWSSPWMLLAVVGTVFFGWLFVRAERRAPEPIVPFSLFRNRVVLIGSIISFLVGTAMFGAISFIPLFVQGTLGGTATEAGSVLTPFLLGWVTFAVIGGRLMFRVGYRRTVLAGLVVLAVSFTMLAAFDREMSRVLLLGNVGLMGAGMGLVMLALLITTQNSVPRSQLGIATSLNQFARSIGGAVGVAAMGAVMTVSLMSQLGSLRATSSLPAEEVARFASNPSALVEPAGRAQIPPDLLGPMLEAFGNAIHRVFVVGAFFAIAALLAGYWLPHEPFGGPAPEAAPEARTPAECERLLVAEMTTLDADNEPSAFDRSMP